MDEGHAKELERQLFWLKHENLGIFEDVSNVPNELLCPITQEIFREPVICAGKESLSYIIYFFKPSINFQMDSAMKGLQLTSGF